MELFRWNMDDMNWLNGRNDDLMILKEKKMNYFFLLNENMNENVKFCFGFFLL